eukprot:TRINITY_DN3323_c0_g3_i4.p1 TRINITY_DN3323_c0_g3~~TRINITY_DN3323_c0_g3_i4.p1  ORF type:complete len:424 (+),score=115.67 TRINITY_DN3323_c0_g3_i4:34-1272(+)
MTSERIVGYERNLQNNIKYGMYPGKAEEDHIGMWVADQDLEIAPIITKHLCDRIVDIPNYGYEAAPESFYNAILQNSFEHNIKDIDRKNVLFVPNVLSGLIACLNELTSVGSTVVLANPIYFSFIPHILNIGRQVKTVPLQKDSSGHFIYDFEQLEDVLSNDDVSLFVFCNPHNPGFKVFTVEETLRITELCEKYGVVFVSDEIHCDLVLDGSQFNSALSVYDKAIILTSVSKTFNLAMIETAWILCKDTYFLKRLKKYSTSHGFFPTPFATVATTTAINLAQPWRMELIKFINHHLDLFENLVKKTNEKFDLNIVFVRPQASYLFWIDLDEVSQGKVSGDTYQRILRDDYNISVSSGDSFGSKGRGCMRVNCAISDERFNEALIRFEKFFEYIALNKEELIESECEKRNKM